MIVRNKNFIFNIGRQDFNRTWGFCLYWSPLATPDPFRGVFGWKHSFYVCFNLEVWHEICRGAARLIRWGGW